MAAIGEALGRLARDLDGLPVQIEGMLLQLELGQRDRRAAEGVSQHHVGAGLEIAVVDLAHHIGAREHQHVRAVLLAPEVAFDVEVHRLHASTRAAITQENTVAQGIEQMRT